jgi:hypothetical protein
VVQCSRILMWQQSQKGLPQAVKEDVKAEVNAAVKS